MRTPNWHDRALLAWGQWWRKWGDDIRGDDDTVVACALAFQDGYLAGVRDAQKEQVEALDG